MATETRSKGRTPKAKPADTCKLTLTIRGIDYLAKPFSTPEGRGVSLRKVGVSDPYHVVETKLGPVCDCADFEFRHEGRDAVGCKHCRALVAVGLISGVEGIYSVNTPSSKGVVIGDTPKGVNNAYTPSAKGVRTNDTLPAPKPSRPGIDRVADEFDPAPGDDPDDVESDPSTWGSWTDQHVYAPTRANLVIGGVH